MELRQFQTFPPHLQNSDIGSVVDPSWSDPKLFAGSESIIINFGSGSNDLQFLMTKIA